MLQERRRFPRYKPQGNYVISCYNAEFSGKANDNYNLASRILDLGPRGACMLTVGRLRVGVPLVIDIHIPHERSHFKARAVVRWSQTLQSKDPVPKFAHVVGLEFDKVFDAHGHKGEMLASGVGAPKKKGAPEPRRRHKRFVTRGAQVVCVPKGFWNVLGFKTNAGRKLKDLSLGGAQIVTSQKLKPGQAVELRLDLQEQRAVIRAVGQVKWCRRDTTTLEPRWNVGVVFKQLSPEDDQHLKAVARGFLE